MLHTVLFYTFAVCMLGAAAGVVFSRNPVHSVMYLVLTFFQSALLWLMAEAEFLAIVLVLVYVGAVMVLFLFIVMMLDVNIEFTHDMINHDNNYVGEKYGAPTKDGTKAMKLLAKKEGIVLDPVYTSKGFAALLDYVKKGIIKKGENVIFMFTGGSPAIFAYNEELSKKNS